MDTQKLILFLSFSSACFSILLITGCGGVDGGSHSHHHRHTEHMSGIGSDVPKKLFVFGDSYADTGNQAISLASSWKVPYGITFPGKPSGRFSDGRVFTDYFARFVGIKSPIAYRWRKYGGDKVRFGMNFAVGGTGVFQTLEPGPNMTTQIGSLQQLLKDSVYSAADLGSAVALVSLAGNDYGALLAKNVTDSGLLAFIPRVVNQLALNLKQIHDLGIKKVVVSGLQPLGCLPHSTASSSFRSCNATANMAVALHNLLLQRAVVKLNLEAQGPSFFVLNLYASFMSIFENKTNFRGESKFGNPLKPCCAGLSKEYSCGSLDTQGAKMYKVCEKPDSAFFWDNAHPTQAGWNAVYSTLQPSLQQIWT